MTIHLNDDDTKVVLSLLANLRNYAVEQAASTVPDLAKTGVGIVMILDGVESVMRSCEVGISPEDRERRFLRGVALADQLEAFGGGP